MKRWVLTYLETFIMFVTSYLFIYASGYDEPTTYDAVMFGILYTTIVDLRKDVKGW